MGGPAFQVLTVELIKMKQGDNMNEAPVERSKKPPIFLSVCILILGIASAILRIFFSVEGYIPGMPLGEDGFCTNEITTVLSMIFLVPAEILRILTGSVSLRKISQNESDYTAILWTDIICAALSAAGVIACAVRLVLRITNTGEIIITAVSVAGLLFSLLHGSAVKNTFAGTLKSGIPTRAAGSLLLAALCGIICAEGCYISCFGEKNSGADSFAGICANDLQGNVYTDSVIEKSKITLINVWATFCSPCIAEMPYLDEISHMYPQEKVRIVGICADVTDSSGNIDAELYEKCIKIANEDLGIGYTVIVPSADMQNGILKDIFTFPTTFVVDSEGNILECFSGSRNRDEFIEIIEKYKEIWQ